MQLSLPINPTTSCRRLSAGNAGQARQLKPGADAGKWAGKVIPKAWEQDETNPILVQALEAIRACIDRHVRWRGAAGRPTLHGWRWAMPTCDLPISRDAVARKLAVILTCITRDGTEFWWADRQAAA